MTGSFLSGPPESLLGLAGVGAPGLKSGMWWSLLTSLFFATNPLAYLTASLMILLLLGLAERQLGSVRTAIFLCAGQFAAVTLFLLLTQLALYAGDGWLSLMVDYELIGPYAAILSVALSASAQLPALWRRRLRTALLAASMLLVFYIGHAVTVFGLLGSFVGLIGGWWIQRDQGTLRLHRSTGRETRNLLALTVGIFAVGPFLETMAKSPTGPLALLRDIVLSPLPTLSQLEANCGGTIEASCLVAGRQGFGGPLGLALAVVPVVLLLICADGMRRGRRLALGITLAVQLVITSLSAVYLTLFAMIPHFSVRSHTGVLGTAFAHLLPLVAVPLLLAVLLWAHRRQFRVEASPGSRRALAAVVGGTWLVLAGGYAVFWLSAGGMERDGGTWGLVAELARQYLPLPIPNLYRSVFAGRSDAESLLFAYSGIVFWAIALASVWIVMLRRHHATGAARENRELAKDLIRQGGDALSWMALWEPNRYWFTPTRGGGVAHQQHGNVALTLAGPFGDSMGHEETAAGFLDYCGDHALIPCFYSCTDQLWPLLQARGFRRVAVAQETRLAVRELEFRGKEWQNVRTALNRARKSGISAVWGSYGDLPPALRTQLTEVSEEWAVQKPVPEMSFTLGGIDEVMDDDVLCCLAVGADGTVFGVTSWLPVYHRGKLVSRTLDFMRRRGEGFPGVMEFLIASAVLELRKSVEVISLSGSPLAKDPGQPGPGELGTESQTETLSRILDVVGHALEPAYGFRSLAAFKSRFQPEYRTLYLYYQDALHLPAIGLAVTRAYLPGLSLRQSARLLSKIMRSRDTAGI